MSTSKGVFLNVNSPLFLEYIPAVNNIDPWSLTIVVQDPPVTPPSIADIVGGVQMELCLSSRPLWGKHYNQFKITVFNLLTIYSFHIYPVFVR